MPNTKNRLAGGFLSSVSKFPSGNALVINDRSFTYHQLMDMASDIAIQVQENQPGQRVGIYCSHSAMTYATVLAVTMIGKSYVPLNPQFPGARLQEIIDLSGITLLLTEKRLELRGVRQHILNKVAKNSPLPQLSAAGEEAYLLFTSGTTGTPKGVPVTHGNLEGFFKYFDTFDFRSSDRFIQSFDLSFDVSVMMMFLCWSAGACLYPVSAKGHKPFNVLSCIRDNHISVCAMVPSLLNYIERYLREQKMEYVRYSFFAGERLSVRHARLWQDACPASRVFNAYGPSEATIVCMAHEFLTLNVSRYGADVPIGKPFEGTEVLLVDEQLKETEKEGEICLSGGQVIDHYLNKVEEKRFFSKDGKRFYRTGDFGVMDLSGDLVFAGRIDTQVKLNGYRIEPEEIRRVIYDLTGLRSEVLPVVAGTETRLVAFLESKEHSVDLGKSLAAVLPAFMIPTEFICLKEMPIGSHDKVDQKRLLQLYNERPHT